MEWCGKSGKHLILGVENTWRNSRDQRSFPVLFQKGRNLSLAIKEIEERRRANEDVLALLEFIKSSKRGVWLGA